MSRERPGNRTRVPAPVIRWRLPSGRGATEQPNVTGDGDVPLTLRFWIAIVVVGVAAGLLGAAMMVILFNAQFLAFGYHSGSFQAGVDAASGTRRVLSLLIAGAFGGVAWYLLRRATPGERSDIDGALWGGDARLSVRRSVGTSVISEIVIGMGASIGREAAPKLLGGMAGGVAADRLGLSAAQRRVLVACGGGAGLAAVYNVPLGGALLTAEVLIGVVTLPAVLPALACSAIATGTAWVYLPDRPTYIDIPTFHMTWTLTVWAVFAGIVIGLVAVAYVRLLGWISHHQMKGRAVLVAPLAVLAVLGVIGLQYPQLFGNGKDMAHAAFLGQYGLILLLVLFLLKPLVTALCLGSGMSGGLFTPVLSTGAVLGGFLGVAWSHLWPGSPAGAYALVGAAAMIGAAMQAPLAGLVLVVELTQSGFQLMVPMIVATLIATVINRQLDGYSIYSARLPAEEPGQPRAA